MDTNYYTSLENKIYETRKSRIAASERLKKWDLFLYIINIYYSLFVVILSIWNLKNSNNTKTSLALLIISVIAFSFTLFISSLNLKEKSISFKNNYIALEKLHSRLLKLQSNPNESEDPLYEVNIEYDNLLENSDNHETIDYHCSLYEDKQKFSSFPPERQSLIKKDVISHRVKNILIKIIFVIAPFLLPYLIKFIDKYVLCL